MRSRLRVQVQAGLAKTLKRVAFSAVPITLRFPGTPVYVSIARPLMSSVFDVIVLPTRLFGSPRSMLPTLFLRPSSFVRFRA